MVAEADLELRASSSEVTVDKQETHLCPAGGLMSGREEKSVR